MPIRVMKYGSSVLTTAEDLPAVADDIASLVNSGHCVIAVVSAYEGRTNELIARAHEKCLPPFRPEYARLVSAGEHESAADLHRLLTRRVIASNITTAKLIGLVAEGMRDDAIPRYLNVNAVKTALVEKPVLVVPGFCAVDREGQPMLLGRGGTDLTAIHLAAKLDIGRVRLVKDVDGVYDRDPNTQKNAHLLSAIDYETALSVSDDLIQPKALRYAQEKGVTVEISALGLAPGTMISAS